MPTDGRRPRTRFRGEQGYILAMTALLILPLMVFVSFAIDAGSWYAQASRMQRAADAAALAAVVWLPNETNAISARDTVAAQNGYATGVTGSVTSPTTYKVTITADAPRFFSGTFDSSPYDLTRSATAEFNKPVPLGSPTNKMGNDVENCPQYQPSQTSPCGPQPMLWSAIQGPYETFQNGDPYTTKCGRNQSVSESACSSGPYARGATNELYRTTGYSFAIDVKPADVGKTMQFQVWDAGSYPRSTGTNSTKNVRVRMSSGDTTLNRVGGSSFANSDVGQPITGTGIPPGTVVASYFNNSRIEMSNPATGNSNNRTVTITTAPNADCNRSIPPFSDPPYNGSLNTQNCQTGDRGTAPFDLQIYENDGQDLTVDYSTPIPSCHLFVAEGADAATYKNKWATVCDFTPTLTGVYPLRVKSSAIPGVTDSGSGYNAYAMRLQGAAGSRLYALDDLSIWTNTPSSDARFYLAEIGPEHSGKRIQLDLFDPGDGNGGQYTMQVLAPPSGSPNAVPTSGTTIPAAGIADSCRYNSNPSPTKGPDVAAPNGSAATNCTVITRYSGGSGGVYNNNWLRIEIKIADNYTCTTDCWWTIKYDFGSGGLPTDRTVWSIKVVGDPVHLVE